jgi:hypothetical protein
VEHLLLGPDVQREAEAAVSSAGGFISRRSVDMKLGQPGYRSYHPIYRDDKQNLQNEKKQ